MRGIILWVAVGLAAVATGLGLYVSALQTSPATAVTNVPPASDAGWSPYPGAAEPEPVTAPSVSNSDSSGTARVDDDGPSSGRSADDGHDNDSDSDSDSDD
jgi:hypothetical protein